MPVKLTAAQMSARYEALLEASEHLRMTWTDNNLEFSEGLVMSEWLASQANKWLDKSLASGTEANATPKGATEGANHANADL